MGGVGAQPRDCWEVGALQDSCGSQGHGSDGVQGADVLHSLAYPTSCHPYELKSAKFWGTCAGFLCGNQTQGMRAGGKGFALALSFHPGVELGAWFALQDYSLCCHILLSLTHLLGSIKLWLSSF